MKMILICFCLIFSGCANTASTRLFFKADDSTLIVEIPKEIEAKKLKVVYDSKQKSFEITSDTWISRNSDTILSQASREKAVLESSSALVEKGIEAAVRTAIKTAVPIP